MAAADVLMGGDCVLYRGDCREVLPSLPPVCAVVTDPPYGLVEPRSGMAGVRPRTDAQKAARRGGFMGKAWDAEVPGADTWRAVLSVLRPGGYMLAFGGARTYHRLACAVEDAGFEVRDCLIWLYGTGFPKGKGCLKPAWEPILLARKPGPKVLPLGIDECRVGVTRGVPGGRTSNARSKYGEYTGGRDEHEAHRTDVGRYPANVILDEEAGVVLDEQSGHIPSSARKAKGRGMGYHGATGERGPCRHTDSGGAARFFYTAKASGDERRGNAHPTVKPLALMRWLVRLVTPPDGKVLDPFAGSFSTGVAAAIEGRKFVGVERDEGYYGIGLKRLAAAAGCGPGQLFDGYE